MLTKPGYLVKAQPSSAPVSLLVLLPIFDAQHLKSPQPILPPNQFFAHPV